MLLVWCFCNKYIILDSVFCDSFSRYLFCLFLIVAIFFLMIVHVMISFIIVIFILVVLCFLFFDYLPTLFLDMSGFVTAMKFWYICPLFMIELFFFVTIFPAGFSGTLVLGFYVKDFLIFYLSFWSWLFIHLVKFHQKLYKYVRSHKDGPSSR